MLRHIVLLCHWLQNCKLGHGRRLRCAFASPNPSAVIANSCTHRRCRRDKTVSSRQHRRCVLGFRHTACSCDYPAHLLKSEFTRGLSGELNNLRLFIMLVNVTQHWTEQCARRFILINSAFLGPRLKLLTIQNSDLYNTIHWFIAHRHTNHSLGHAAPQLCNKHSPSHCVPY